METFSLEDRQIQKEAKQISLLSLQMHSQRKTIYVLEELGVMFYACMNPYHPSVRHEISAEDEQQ